MGYFHASNIKVQYSEFESVEEYQQAYELSRTLEPADQIDWLVQFKEDFELHSREALGLFLDAIPQDSRQTIVDLMGGEHPEERMSLDVLPYTGNIIFACQILKSELEWHASGMTYCNWTDPEAWRDELDALFSIAIPENLGWQVGLYDDERARELIDGLIVRNLLFTIPLDVQNRLNAIAEGVPVYDAFIDHPAFARGLSQAISIPF